MLDVKITSSGIQQAQQGLRELQKSLGADAGTALFEFSKNFLLPRIALNTPIFTGKLRANLYVTLPIVKNNVVGIRIRDDLPYSLKMHEAEYQLGPRSQAQPTQPEGGVGNKYVSRVVFYHAEKIKQILKGQLIVTTRKAFASGNVRTIGSFTV